MAMQSNHVKLDFEKMTEAGLKPLAKKFEKWGLTVKDIASTNKAKRESGFMIKDATFTFSDGQQMLVRVKQEGTVFQVKLNNKVVPIKNVADINKAVIEMVDYIQSNAKAYENAKIQREKRKKLNVPVPVVRTTRQERLEKTQAALAEVQGSLENLQKQAADLTAASAEKTNTLTNIEAELKAEQDRTAQLETELKTLQEAA